MNKEKWEEWEPILKKMKFGDNVYSDTDRYKFLGLSNQRNNSYVTWDTIDGDISTLELQSDKELKWYADQKIRDEIQEYKKTLPWYNLYKYV